MSKRLTVCSILRHNVDIFQNSLSRTRCHVIHSALPNPITISSPPTFNSGVPLRCVHHDDHVLDGQHLLDTQPFAFLLGPLDTHGKRRPVLLEALCYNDIGNMLCILGGRDVVAQPAQTLALPKSYHCRGGVACDFYGISLGSGFGDHTAKLRLMEHFRRIDDERCFESRLWSSWAREGYSS